MSLCILSAYFLPVELTFDWFLVLLLFGMINGREWKFYGSEGFKHVWSFCIDKSVGKWYNEINCTLDLFCMNILEWIFIRFKDIF